MYKGKTVKKQNSLYLCIFVTSIVCYFYALSFTTLELWEKILVVLAATLIIFVIQFIILYTFKQYIQHKKLN
ncbi:hypothetical protein [Clostridium sp.]|uniref:hypothetical protein n=1 Tax=Clostridium sp. TaxID=1506 RepID=UPI00261A52BC|nr:hypothetical protein [Clostridium sp.]